MWGVVLPGIELDSLWACGRERWRLTYLSAFDRIPDHRDSDKDVAFDVLGLRSPDGGYILDVDTGMTFMVEGDHLSAGGEPESYPALIDLRSKTHGVLELCGSTCWFSWGTWASPTTFALGGWRYVGNDWQWIQGQLFIYSIPDSTRACYRTRVVPIADYSRFKASRMGGR